MNTHPVSNEDVMAYLDGELSPEAAGEMTAHLTQCRACQDVAADLQGVSRQLAGWMVEPAELGGGMPTEIATALAERGADKPKGNSPWKLRLVGAAIAAVLLVALIPSARHLKTASPQAHKDYAKSVVTTSGVVGRGDENAEPFFPQTKMLANVPVPTKVASDMARVEATPLVVRTAELRITAHNFDAVRAELDRTLFNFGGHVGQLNVIAPVGEARSLSATLQIPSRHLEAAMAELRKLGRVDRESQSGEEVTQQAVDVEARLANARHTEQRLIQILATKTGKLSDVLEVEEKLSEVRGLIEQAEAEQKSLNNRIAFAAVSLQITEEYRAPLTPIAPTSVSTRLSNSAVQGLLAAFDGTIEVIQALLAAGPSILLICGLLGLPAYFLWKKFRH